jgi:transposase
VICAATLLAEIGDSRQRYPTAEHLAADAGMAPVAVESGRRKVACFRRGCDHRLRAATSTLADATRHHHPWAQDRVRRRPRPRPPTRDPNPRTRLDPRPLALLARPHPYDPPNTPDFGLT